MRNRQLYSENCGDEMYINGRARKETMRASRRSCSSRYERRDDNELDDATDFWPRNVVNQTYTSAALCH